MSKIKIEELTDREIQERILLSLSKIHSNSKTTTNWITLIGMITIISIIIGLLFLLN